MILPARRSFQLLALNLGLALLASFLPALLPLWLALLGLSTLVWLLDALRSHRLTLPLERHMPQSLPLGVTRQVRLRLHNDSRQPRTVWVHDHAPPQLQTEGLPLKLSIPPGTWGMPVYGIRALARGRLQFQACQLRLLSLGGLWWIDRKVALETELRVYPNFSAVAQYALMATDNHLSHLGIMKRRRRGEGQDFHQLREYRAGDSLRQIDWKASSRMGKTIAREYQDERDQEIILLLDCGHRMLARDGELSHFDHTLNAMLLLSYIALRQGDAVGLLAFSGEQRWLPPRKGHHHLNQLLNAVYELQARPQAPDFSQAAMELLVRQKKRALVIVLSNLRDEDTDDLLPALHLMRKRHLVLFASLREQILDQTLEAPVDNLEDAINHAATTHYLATRTRTLEALRASHILCLDVPPEQLSTRLINHYLDIKRSGSL